MIGHNTTLTWHCAMYQAKKLVPLLSFLAAYAAANLALVVNGNNHMPAHTMTVSFVVAWCIPVIWILVAVPVEARRHRVNLVLEAMAYRYSGADDADMWLAQFRCWLHADLFCCQYGASTEATILALDGCANGFYGHLIACVYPEQNNRVDVHRLAQDFARMHS